VVVGEGVGVGVAQAVTVTVKTTVLVLRGPISVALKLPAGRLTVRLTVPDPELVTFCCRTVAPKLVLTTSW
jgi:hypothetical protein